MILKASAVDYSYSGNLSITVNKNEDGYLEYSIYSAGANRLMEYSIDEKDYTDFENIDSTSKGSRDTDFIRATGKIDVIVVRDKETKKIYMRGICINDSKEPLVLYKADVGWSKGSYICFKNGENNIPFEYSIDNGKNFNDIVREYVWSSSMKINNGDLFLDRIIIRNKNTKEIIYESPKIGEIEEKYTYENGRTTGAFNVNGDAQDRTSYTYTISGEKLNGNSITVEDDTNITLFAYTNKEFLEQSTTKEIDVKVIRVEKPEIEVDEEDNLILIYGEVTNDEQGNPYYSIDNEEYLLYTDKVKLEPGTHTIKAYQESKEYKVESEVEAKEITIDKQETDDNDDNNQNSDNDNIQDDNNGNNQDNNNDNNQDNNNDNNQDNNNDNNQENNDDSNQDNDNDNNEDNNDNEDNNKDNNKDNNNDNSQDNNNNEETKNNESESNHGINNENNDKAQGNNTQNAKKDKTPQTGDNIFRYVVSIFAIIILNIVVKYRRRK